MTPTLDALSTPCLMLDEARMMQNIARIHGRLADTGVSYRAHLKTAKSIEVARRQMLGPSGPAMVSTLREAEVFADAGVTDMIYGVGIAPQKLGQVLALRARGVDLAVILDSVAQAEAVAAASSPDLPLAALIEIDCDGHRSGVKPDDAGLLTAIARRWHRRRNFAGSSPTAARAMPHAARRPSRLRPRASGWRSSPQRKSCVPPATPVPWSAPARRRR